MQTAFILTCEPPLPIDGVIGMSYAGIDRQPWSCVDDLRYAQALPDVLNALRTRSLDEYIGNLTFGTLSSYQEVVMLAAACRSASGIAITEVASIGLLTESPTPEMDVSAYVGLDCFVDGYGSIIRLGLVNKPACFAPVLDTVNAHGLLRSIDAAHRYMRHYLSIMDASNLEIIDPTLPIWIYGLHR